MGDVAQGVARFEETRALDHHEGPGAAEHEAAGDADRFALARRADEPGRAGGLQGFVPLAEMTVRHPDDVRHPAGLERSDDGGTVDHWDLQETRPSMLLTSSDQALAGRSA